MNEQRLLFGVPGDAAQGEPKPLSHRGDPRTSREAAEQLRKSGGLHTQRQAVLEALRQCNGATHAELGAFMGLHWLTPARRLPEFARAGLVKKGEARICTVKGSRCTTWWITSAESAQQPGTT